MRINICEHHGTTILPPCGEARQLDKIVKYNCSSSRMELSLSQSEEFTPAYYSLANVAIPSEDSCD